MPAGSCAQRPGTGDLKTELMRVGAGGEGPTKVLLLIAMSQSSSSSGIAVVT